MFPFSVDPTRRNPSLLLPVSVRENTSLSDACVNGLTAGQCMHAARQAALLTSLGIARVRLSSPMRLRLAACTHVAYPVSCLI